MREIIMVKGKTLEELEEAIKAKEAEGYERYGDEVHQVCFAEERGSYYRQMVRDTP